VLTELFAIYSKTQTNMWNTFHDNVQYFNAEADNHSNHCALHK